MTLACAAAASLLTACNDFCSYSPVEDFQVNDLHWSIDGAEQPLVGRYLGIHIAREASPTADTEHSVYIITGDSPPPPTDFFTFQLGFLPALVGTWLIKPATHANFLRLEDAPDVEHPVTGFVIIDYVHDVECRVNSDDYDSGGEICAGEITGSLDLSADNGKYTLIGSFANKTHVEGGCR